MKPYPGGFTYFGVLFVLVLLGLALTGASAVWQLESQRMKERELLYIGMQYLQAIESFRNSGQGVSRYPKTMDELLRDPRSATLRRHLRKRWRDPMTGSLDWGLVRTRLGGIAGVYSLGQGTPLKQANFGNPTLDKLLSGKTSYRQWRFVDEQVADDQDNTPDADGNPDDADLPGDLGGLDADHNGLGPQADEPEDSVLPTETAQ